MEPNDYDEILDLYEWSASCSGLFIFGTHTLCFQTISEAHPASYPTDNDGPFPEVKRDQGVTLTTHTHLVTRLEMSRSYTSFSP
jgi:hypothetical protein